MGYLHIVTYMYMHFVHVSNKTIKSSIIIFFFAKLLLNSVAQWVKKNSVSNAQYYKIEIFLTETFTFIYVNIDRCPCNLSSIATSRAFLSSFKALLERSGIAIELNLFIHQLFKFTPNHLSLIFI